MENKEIAELVKDKINDYYVDTLDHLSGTKGIREQQIQLLASHHVNNLDNLLNWLDTGEIINENI